MQLTSLSLALTRAGFLSFSPASLFAAGEQGVFFDPSDMSTMFQDAAGTTPVTAVEQPVGLILDKSRGLVLGAEVVANGTFDSGAAGWSAGANAASVSASAGRLTVVSVSAGFGRAVTTISLTAGRIYKVEAEVVSTTCALVSVGVAVIPDGSGDSAILSFSSVGKRSAYFVAGSTGRLTLRQDSTANGTTTWESVSIRELPGNHATQPSATLVNATACPVLSARVNLLTKTEQFDDAAWTKIGVVTQTNVIQETVASSRHAVESQVVLSGGLSYRASIEAKANSASFLQLTFTGAPSPFANFDLVNGVVTASGDAAGGGGFVGATIKLLSDGYYRCEIVGILQTGTNYSSAVGLINDVPTAGRNPSYMGSGKSLFVRKMDVRSATNMGVGLPAYQRVNTATDYDTAGFPHYLRFDGIDDWLVTPSIDFTATDKMTVFAGIRKLSDVASGIVAELSSNAGGNTQSFALFAPGSNGANHLRWVPEAGRDINSPNQYPAPISAVLAGVGEKAGNGEFRVNGVSVGVGFVQTAGNYGNYPLYIGRRGGTTIPFNGNLYSLIVRGAQSTAQQIASAEAWVNGKTGAY